MRTGLCWARTELASPLTDTGSNRVCAGGGESQGLEDPGGRAGVGQEDTEQLDLTM